MKLSENTFILLDILKNNGHKAYVVGGCVRDFLKGTIPTDIDVATSATPLQVLEIFKQYKCVPTGIKHGTVTVFINKEQFEVTTFRRDGEYIDKRRPMSVEFSQDIYDDLSRRDFTINAMAYNVDEGIIDEFNGRNDLKNGIIKTVGDANTRFYEDALRIMRAIRFCATLGFTIDEQTKNAIFNGRNLLSDIAIERIYIEFCKTILSDNAAKTILEYKRVFAVFLPELLYMEFEQKNPHHTYDVLSHSLIAMQNIEKEIPLRLAALFHDVGKPKTFSIDDDGIGHFFGHAKMSETMTQEILSRLKCDNMTKNHVLKLIKHHDLPLIYEEKIIKRNLSRYGREYFDILKLIRADNLAQNPIYHTRQEEISKIEVLAHEILEKESCLSLKQLKISGNDLIKLGFSGVIIGEILRKMLEMVIDGEIENDYSKLINYVKTKQGENDGYN